MSRGATHRRRRLRRPAALVALLGASGLAVLLGQGLNSAGAAALCDGRKVRTVPFETGEIRVHRDGGYVCAVAVADRAGVRQPMSVSVQARGSAAVADSGMFRYHAGPVTVHAGRRCVSVRARIGEGEAGSGWILC